MAGFTKKAILETFVELLNEQPFDKITVKDVVEQCGINRNTFYYYYQDIYALLNDLIETELNKTLTDMGDVSNWQAGVEQALSFAIANKKAVYHIYNSLNRDVMVKYFRKIMTDLSIKFIGYIAGLPEEETSGSAQKSGRSVLEGEDTKLLADILVDAEMGMLISWLEEGMTSDIETRVAQVQFLFDGVVNDIVTKMKSPEYKRIKSGKR